MSIKNIEARRNYYRNRYHRTRADALKYVAGQHADALIELAIQDNYEQKRQAIADYLIAHCIFRAEKRDEKLS